MPRIAPPSGQACFARAEPETRGKARCHSPSQRRVVPPAVRSAEPDRCHSPSQRQAVPPAGRPAEPLLFHMERIASDFCVGLAVVHDDNAIGSRECIKAAKLVMVEVDRGLDLFAGLELVA